MTGKSVQVAAVLALTGAAMAASAGSASAADRVVEWGGVVVTVSGANSEVVHVRTPFWLYGEAHVTYITPDGKRQHASVGDHFPFGLDAHRVVPGRIVEVKACGVPPSPYLPESFSGKPRYVNCSPAQTL